MRTIADIFRSQAVLDAEGRHVNGCDKMSNHNYGDAYEQIFTIKDVLDDPGEIIRLKYPYSIRSDVKLMMEIGVADGSSLLGWREVFPNALCVGMDIHPAARLTESLKYGVTGRIEFYLGDQRSQQDCERAVGRRIFDVIVEDATHILEDTLRTFLYLWPYVAPGGLYIVEEFANIGALRRNIAAMWSSAEIVDTQGPFGGVEPLVVFRKPK